MYRTKAKGIFIKRLVITDVTPDYVRWMNDPEVTRFMECRWTKFTLNNLRKYVKNMRNSKADYLFGIFLSGEKRHIGNIKIGSISKKHAVADLGLAIGDKSEWGKGYATEAIKLATEFAFTKLKLKKLYAGIYSNNAGSLRAFKKAGYKVAGKLLKHRICGKDRVDVFLVEKLRN